MTLEEFRRLDDQMRQQKPKLFELSVSDPRASDAHLLAVESVLRIRLPESYRSFLQEFGGGSFGLAVIYSADSASEWYLPKKHISELHNLPGDMLAFSEDFAGGFYTFKITAGHALEPVFYWNDDGGESQTPFADIFDYLANHAYEAP